VIDQRTQLQKSDSMNGNRRYARQVVTPRLYVSMNGSSAGGIMYDVSLGGLSLDVVGPTPASERVLLNFDLSETGQHFEGAGLIIWKSEFGNRVGIQFANLPEASHLKIKTWLSAKSAAGSGAQNVVVQDRMDATFLEQAAVLPERAFNSNASTATATSTVREAPISKQQAIAEYVDRIPPRPPVAPPRQEERSNATRAESHEREIRELRSSFFPLPGTEPQGKPDTAAENTPRDWKRVLQWTLAGVFVVVAVLMLAMVIKMASSPQFDAGARYRAIKAKVDWGIAKLMSSPAQEVTQPGAPKAKPQLNGEVKPQIGKRSTDSGGAHSGIDSGAGAVAGPETNSSAPPTQQFQVMDAQHGRRYVPRTGTSVTVQFERPLSNEQAARRAAQGEAIPGYAVVDRNSAPQSGASGSSAGALSANDLKLGRVLRESSGELPITETMPDYPTFALRTNVQGRVLLTAIITRNGSLKDVVILSSPSVLDSTVLQAVRSWRYNPHYEKGVPVEAVTEIVVDFSITTK
jgi:TonB family protein